MQNTRYTGLVALVAATMLWAGVAGATGYIDVYVVKDAQPYSPQHLVDVQDTEYSWVKSTYTNHITLTASLLSQGTTTDVHLYILPGYDDQVYYWQCGTEGAKTYAQTLDLLVSGGTTTTVYCYLSQAQTESVVDPVTELDMPLANTLAGIAPAWGPEGSAGGVVRLYSGEFTENAVDLAVPGRGLDLVFGRRYLSRDRAVDSVVGNNWDFSHDFYVTDPDSWIPNSITVNLGNGRAVHFEDYYQELGNATISSGTGINSRRPYVAEAWPCIFGAIPKDYSGGECFLRWSDGTVWIFDDVIDAGGGQFGPTQIRDLEGNTIQFTYNAAGKVSGVTDTMGRHYTLAYYTTVDDAENVGKLKTITEDDGLSRQVKYEYYSSTLTDITGDSSPDGNTGDLARVTYLTATEDERSVSYVYALPGGIAPEGSLLEILDAKGRTVVENTYNEFGQVEQQTFEDAQIVKTYDYSELATAESVDIGHASSTNVDAVRQTVVTDAEGIATQYLFDEGNHVIRKRQPFPSGYDTTYCWNNQDNLTETEDSGGCHTLFGYESDVDIRPLRRGHVTTTTRYDNAVPTQNFIQTENQYLNLCPATVNGLHLVQYHKFYEASKTLTTTYAYDANANLGRITYPENPELNFESFTYNAYGLLASHTTPPTVVDSSGNTGNARVDTFTYNFNGNGPYSVVTVQDSAGEQVTSTDYYDAVGRLVKSVDPKGNATNYEYTPYDMLARTLSPAPGNGSSARPSTTYAYDENNNLERVTVAQFDEAGTAGRPIVTRYIYDDMDRVEQVVRDENGLAATTEYEYDLNSRLIKETTPEAVAGLQPDNYVEYAYDERDLLFTVTQAGQETTQYDYDDWGNVSTVTYPDTTTQTYTYDSYGRLATTTDSLGTVTEVVARNKRGLVLHSRVKDDEQSLLAQTHSTYDDMGRLSTQNVNADPVGTRYFYTPAGQLWKVQDPEDRITTTAFDSMHRVASTRDGQGNVTTYTYDDNSNVIQVAQSDYNEATTSTEALPPTSYTYDKLNRRISTTDMAGHVTQAKFDSLGRLRWAQDAEGNFSRFGYDTLSRRISTARYESGGSTPLASITQAYDLNGRLVSRSDPKGYSTTYDYDELDRQLSVDYADGSATTVLAYDAMRRPTQLRQPDGTTVANTYDDEGRLTARTTTAPNGVLATNETFAYDALGRVTQETTNSGTETFATVTSYTYNDTVDPPTVTKNVTVGSLPARTITTTYLHTGEPSQKTLTGGRTLAYTYNDGGQVAGISVDSSPLAAIKHAGGRRAEHTLGGGVKAAFNYTPATYGLRVAGTTHTDMASTPATLDARTNTWDANYNRTGRSVTAGPQSLQASHTCAYDGLNRMESSADGTETLSYTLDAAGNRTQVSDGTTPETYTLSGTGALMHQYSAGPQGSFGYDGAGRLNSLVTDNKSYRYDALGRLKELRLGAGVAVQEMDALPSGSVQDSGTWVVTNQYLEETSAGGGRIHWSPAAGLRRFSFDYWSEHDPADPDGDEDQDPDHFDPEYYAQAVLRANQYTSGEYAGEWKFLAVVIQPDGVYLRQWDHDEVTELGGVAVEIPKDEWHSVTIELSGADGGHVVVKHRLHDAAEPQTIEADTTILGDGDVGFGVGKEANFYFDNAGTDVVVNPGVALRYHYDASGRVVGRTLDPSGANLSQFFIYDEDRIVQELDGDGDPVAEWVYGDYIDEIFAMYRDTDANGSLDATYYYIQDDLYNVVALTDEDGEVVERYSYDDYGMPTVWVKDGQGTWIEHTDAAGAPVSSIGNPFMFTGRRWDPELGLYDFRTRYYDPALGRFLRVDTIGPWGDPANLGNPYTYLGNNPWSGTDPWGQQTTFGITYYYDKDGNVVTVELPRLGEVYDKTAGKAVRKIDPNPGPVRAALENEILMVDRSDDIDLVANGNNVVYTGTQLAINFIPISWLTK